MASVNFQDRGRNKRVPLSLYAPLRVTDEKPLFKVLANDAVPQGHRGVTKDQQIGYWNEQIRWRMRRGERVDLASNWHFYYLGTGPHADVPYRKRTQGVYWVALGGAKTEPTGLPTRKPSMKPLEPEFKSNLPSNVEIVEPITPQNSRANSRSRSRGPQSRDQSSSRNDSQSRNNKSQSRNNSSNRKQNQNQNQSRNQSKNRNQSNDRGNSRDDLIDAVKAALQSLGIGQNQQPKQQQQQQPKQQNKQNSSSGKNTPKNKSRSNSKQRQDQKEKPEWRRVPLGDENVEVCFGPRGGFRNFGDAEMIQKGVTASGYAQVASFAPGAAALLFGGNVAVRELSDEVEITYTYKMNVPKDDPNLALFLEQVDAFKKGAPKEQRTKRQKRQKSPAPPPPSNQEEEEGEDDGPLYENLPGAIGDGEGTTVEIVNEVYDDAASSTSA